MLPVQDSSPLARQCTAAPDAAGDEAAELLEGGVVGAGVVQHHHRPVLNVVQPPLGRHVLVLPEHGPVRPAVRCRVDPMR